MTIRTTYKFCPGCGEPLHIVVDEESGDAHCYLCGVDLSVHIVPFPAPKPTKGVDILKKMAENSKGSSRDWIENCSGCGHPAPGHLHTCGAYRKPVKESLEAQEQAHCPKCGTDLSIQGWEATQSGGRNYFVVTCRKCEHTWDSPAIVNLYPAKSIHPFLNTCQETDGPPDFHFLDDPIVIETVDRIAELRVKWPKDEKLPEGKLGRLTYLNEAVADINELLGMLEAPELDGRKKDYQRIVRENEQLKAKLAAKPDIQQDWIRCALIRQAEILKISMSCHKANELTRAVYDEIERQQSE